MRNVLELDFEELDFRAAVSGLFALMATLVFIAAFGPVGVAAGVAALFVIAGNTDDNRGPDASQVLLVPVGAAVTLLVGHSADSATAASLVVAGVALAATLAAGFGGRYATMGIFALLWAVLTIGIGPTDESANWMALAFAIGGALGLAASWLTSQVPDDETFDQSEGATTETAPQAPPGRPSPTSIVTFAVLRALGTGVSVYVGYEWFPDHATWAALTFVLVVQPPAHQTLAVGVGRTLGTALGVILGILVAQLVDGSTAASLIAFVLSGFLMVATKNVNYALSTAFTTTLLLLAQQILQDDVFSTGWERLLATLFGVAMAFAVLVLMYLILRPRRSSSASGARSEPAPEPRSADRRDTRVDPQPGLADPESETHDNRTP